MSKVQCEYCQKWMKTKRGLAQHMKHSTFCQSIKKGLEKIDNDYDESKPNGLDKLGYQKKTKRFGVESTDTLHESYGPSSKIPKILGNISKDKVADFLLQKLDRQPLAQQPYPSSGASEEDATLWHNEDTSSGGSGEEELSNDGDDEENEDEEDRSNGGEEGASDEELSSGEDEGSEEEEESAGTGNDEGAFAQNNSASDGEYEEAGGESDAKKRLANDGFKKYTQHARRNFLTFNKNQRAAVRLMSKLIRKKAPLDTYHDVMEWHLEECGLLGVNESVGKSPHFISRKKLLENLRKRYYMVNQYATPRKILLPHSRSKILIWKKLARDNVLSLLTDPRWTDKDWLYLDDDPFAPPPENSPIIEDVNTGEAYLETYKKLITKERQILVPVLLYIDGAVTGQFDKLQVTALKMSIGLLNRKARDKEYAWRSLGFVTNFTKEDSRGKRMFLDSGHVAALGMFADSSSEEDEGDNTEEVDKAADYHAILSVLLESLKELIADGMVTDIYYKGTLYKDCELVFFVPFVKCDGDEGDKLCLSYRSRGANVQQLCRYCQCPTDESDNPKAKYPYKFEPMMRTLLQQNNAQRLKELSQIGVQNAFHGLRFGLQNDRGVHGACPSELLHAVLLGIFKYVRDCFFAQMGDSSRAANNVNALAQIMGLALHKQSDRSKPRTKFAKGILKGKLMAKEYSGVMLVIAALLQTEQVQDLLISTKRKTFRKAGQISDWVLLVDTLLQWEAYLNLPQMEKRHVQRLKKKHQYVLHLLKKVGAREEGMGFKIQKFHAVLHLASDIWMFGVPMNFDTGSNESHHKTTKVAAKLTQKDVRTFEKQVSDRLDDFHVLDLALQELEGRPLWQYSLGHYHEEILQEENIDSSQDVINNTGGMRFHVFEDNNGAPSFKVTTRMQKKEKLVLDVQFHEFLLMIQRDVEHIIPKMEICAEHRRGEQIFRAHPNYRGKGPWRDWAMIKWEVGEYPAQIWGFLDFTELPDGEEIELHDGTIVDKGVWAVIESCNPIEDNEDGAVRRSEIFDPIIVEASSLDARGQVLERKLYVVDVETFKAPLVVVPKLGTLHQYLMMRPKSQWADDFKRWIEASHRVDEEQMVADSDGE
jgi:hypothetical protein